MLQKRTNRKELVSISIDPVDADILRKYACEVRRSFSETIRIILEEYIAKNKLSQRYKDQ